MNMTEIKYVFLSFVSGSIAIIGETKYHLFLQEHSYQLSEKKKIVLQSISQKSQYKIRIIMHHSLRTWYKLWAGYVKNMESDWARIKSTMESELGI